MRARIIVLSTATMLAVVAAAAVNAQDTLKDDERAITITGCVYAGTAPDSFMLKDLKQLSQGWMAPVPQNASGESVMYWLNTTKGLSDRVGMRVEVAGVVDFSDSHKGQAKVTIDPSKKVDTKTELSSAGRSVTVKTDTKPTVAPIPDATRIAATVPAAAVYDLHVKTVRTVPGDCPKDK